MSIVATGQNLPDTGKSRHLSPCGWDGGYGHAKLLADGEKVKILAYLAFPNGDNEYQISGDGSLIEYLSGDRADLIGKRWLSGLPAYEEFPNSFMQMVDDPESKIGYGLHMFLGSLGTAPYRQHWSLFVQSSIQDAQVFGEDLQGAIAGKHVIRINNSKVSTVDIEMAIPTEEGVGAIAHSFVSGLSSRGQQTILIDVGHGTLITSVFGGDGRLIRDSRKVINSGVDALICAIAKNRQLRREFKCEGDKSIIRSAIERGDFYYGQTGFNFKGIYLTELALWAQSALVPALKAVKPWRATSHHFLGIGGGVNLPGIGEALAKQGIVTIADSQTANVRGLYQLSQLRIKQQNDEF